MTTSLLFHISALPQAQEASTSTQDTIAALLISVTILILAVFVGIEVISKVPTTLHTPLMSGTNAIHGVVFVGAMMIAGSLVAGEWGFLVLAFIAVVFGAGNVMGGFVVTDRMLQMFKKKPVTGGKK